MTPLAVVGAGAFGTALAIQLSRRGRRTLLWGRDRAAISDMQQRRINARYLPACRLPQSLTPTNDLNQVVADAEHLLLAVPSHAFGAMLRELAPYLRGERHGIVCASKGLEPGTGRLAHQVFADVFDDSRPFAVISGPTFATELGLGLPTAVTVASNDPAFAETIARALHGDGFRAYTADDVIGVELGGAAKNVLAIAVGIADGLGLGANTRAALITRGLNEIMRLATALGARNETLMGLSGLGDVVLTCTDDQSRNRRFGLALGRGTDAGLAASEIGTVEGLRAAPELLRLARGEGVEMPIAEQVATVLAGQATPVDALRALAGRPFKAEAQ